MDFQQLVTVAPWTLILQICNLTDGFLCIRILHQASQKVSVTHLPQFLLHGFDLFLLFCVTHGSISSKAFRPL